MTSIKQNVLKNHIAHSNKINFNLITLKTSLIVFLISFQFAVCAQDYNWSNKILVDSLLFSAKRLNEPGYAIIIVEGGKVVYNRSLGLSNVKKNIAISDKTTFGIASVSKQFTAMCILILQERGLLSVSDDIHQYIPELPDYGSVLTINHLLTLTSGIRDHIEVLGWLNNQKRKYYPFEGMLEVFPNYKSLAFKPGDELAYGSTGYMLLALIVERVGGMPFEEFAHKEIFEPLKMNSTEFSLFRKKEKYNYTMSYDWNNNKFKKAYWKEVNALGGTGVYSTLEDMVKWDLNFYENKLGKGTHSLIEAMNTPGELNNGKSTYYGNGQIIKWEQGVEIFKHSGGWNGFNFQYTRIPSRKLSIIIGSNNSKDMPYSMANKIVEAIVPNPNKRKSPPKISPYDLERFVGRYIASDNTLREVVIEDSVLVVKGPGLFRANYFILTRENQLCFKDSLDFNLCFSPKDEMANSFTWQGGTYFQIERKYVRIDSIGFTDSNKFKGEYINDELGRIIIEKKGDKLYLKSKKVRNAELIPVSSRIFNVGNSALKLRFKDKELIIGDSRIYNFRFSKIK